MDRMTRKKLNAINRDFYHEHATSFSGTRAAPWAGWKRLEPHLVEARGPNHSLRVLDAGCGNGRFARFLGERISGDIEYLGLDASEPLLEEARRRNPERVRARFERIDLLEPESALGKIQGPFEFVAVFALLHHIPGTEARLELIRELARRVAPGGYLALSFWNFDNARFVARQISWDEHNAHAPEPIEPGQLEAGDRLLRWGVGADAGVRYCHFADEAERERLTRSTGLEPAETYLADGSLNDYRVLFCKKG
ncbi:MAG: class I SAM-dependent methyltransferase [bacterium]|nr:class I SAM-dependent methyltransferase [bacterium]